MHELFAKTAFVRDACRPRDRHVLTNTAEPGCVLFEPVEWSIECPRPPCRHVVVGLFSAPDIIPLHLNGSGHHVDSVEECNFVWRAKRTAFRAGAVISVNIDDERVIKLTHVFYSLNNAANLVVVICSIGGKDFHLADKELLFIRRKLIPGL